MDLCLFYGSWSFLDGDWNSSIIFLQNSMHSWHWIGLLTHYSDSEESTLPVSQLFESLELNVPPSKLRKPSKEHFCKARSIKSDFNPNLKMLSAHSVLVYYFCSLLLIITIILLFNKTEQCFIQNFF